MKNYYKAVGIISIILILGIIVLAYISRDSYSGSFEDDTTVVILNDIAKIAEENWNDLSVLNEKSYNVDYIILDSSNKLIYNSPNIKKNNTVKDVDKLTVEKAIKNRYPYMYVIRGGQVSGSVILLDNEMSVYHKMRIKMIIGLIIFSVFLILAALFYGLYIHKNIVDPFDKMKSFAGNVARGKLDTPLEMSSNNMFGVFTESFDIMREELAASKKREIELQRRERELVASLSHDLKTPITGIKLTTELLTAKFKSGTENNPTEKTGAIDNSVMIEKLGNIYKKADQIDILVSDLFTSTLDDLGEFKVNCQDEESKILPEILRKYDDKELINSAEVPNVLIQTDSKRMSQVLGNIISNSYKYAGTEIDVSYKVIDDYLEMVIRDYGPGVPKDELALITNKFYRGKQWEESGEDGNGLGLYIARVLMEKMNGELLPESNGEGLSITLLIPMS